MLYGMNHIMNSEEVNVWLGDESNLFCLTVRIDL